MSMTFDHNEAHRFFGLLMRRSIVKTENESTSENSRAVLTLDNGLRIIVTGNHGGYHGEAQYRLNSLSIADENTIIDVRTGLTLDIEGQKHYQLFIMTEGADQLIQLFDFVGNDDNGCNGTGYTVSVEESDMKDKSITEIEEFETLEFYTDSCMRVQVHHQNGEDFVRWLEDDGFRRHSIKEEKRWGDWQPLTLNNWCKLLEYQGQTVLDGLKTISLD